MLMRLPLSGKNSHMQTFAHFVERRLGLAHQLGLEHSSLLLEWSKLRKSAACNRLIRLAGNNAVCVRSCDNLSD